MADATPLVAILAMAAAAVLAGARSMAAIAEWAADAPQLVRVALGARRDAPAHWVVPSEATIRRTLARLDAETLAEVIGAWLADRDRPDQRRRRRAVAVTARPFGAPGVTAAPFTCWPPWSRRGASCTAAMPPRPG